MLLAAYPFRAGLGLMQPYEDVLLCLPVPCELCGQPSILHPQSRQFIVCRPPGELLKQRQHVKPALRLDFGQVGVDQASELLAEGDERVNERVARCVRVHFSPKRQLKNPGQCSLPRRAGVR